LLRGFDRHGIHLRHSWGMTETTPLALTCWLKSSMDVLPEESYYRVRAKQGLPVPFVELRGVSDFGEIPWDGQTMGELQARGPWVASTYHDFPDAATEKWTADGWFRTGDVVTIDPEGYVQIVDRTKDLIKSGGEWISSVALENALMGHPAVREAAVIATPHPKWHERPIAIVVLRDGNILTDEELRAFLAPNFSKWQLPDAFLFVPEIPRTSTGKFLKSKLREMFSNHEQPPD
jgi:fatty-acyl-CoA synthase